MAESVSARIVIPELDELRVIHAAFVRCVAPEIVRLRRGLPHRSWLNRRFREARERLTDDRSEER